MRRRRGGVMATPRRTVRKAPRASRLAEPAWLSVEQRAFARLLAWDGLADTGIDAGEPEPYFTEMVEEVRRRQRGGELADELDPAYVC